MEIAAASIGMNQSAVQNQVQISLLKMSMNDATSANAEMTEMMSNMAVDTNLGNSIDARV